MSIRVMNVVRTNWNAQLKYMSMDFCSKANSKANANFDKCKLAREKKARQLKADSEFMGTLDVLWMRAPPGALAAARAPGHPERERPLREHRADAGERRGR